MSERASRPRPALPVYAVVFLVEMIWAAIIPLAPTYAQNLSLSKVEVGALFASAGFATLLTSLPIGLLADRIGTRALTITASGLLAVSCLGQGVADGFWLLLSARALFGVALAAVWTAGLAWLADSVPVERGSSVLGATVTVSGLGVMVGPSFSGLLADHFGIRVPFLTLALATAAVTVVLLRTDAGNRISQLADQPVHAALKAAKANQFVVASLTVMALLGFVNGGINLLAPLQLRAHGVSAGRIGLAFSASSALFTLISALVARRSRRTLAIGSASAGALLFGVSIVLVLVSTSATAVIAFVLVRSPFWATLATIAYPLGALGAQRAGLGRGAVLGLMNLIWGIANVLGPLTTGAIAQASGERWAYMPLAAACLAAAVWLRGAHHSAIRAYESALQPRPSTSAGQR